MAPSISWTDPAVLRRLLEDASRKRVDDQGAVGRSAARVPKPFFAEATLAGEVAVPVPPPAAFSTVEGSTATRVEHLIDWLSEAQTLTGLFVTDANGLAIATRGVETEQVAICGTLMEALSRVRSSLTSDARRMAVVIDDRNVLHLVAVETAWGSFGVGMVSSNFLSDAFLAQAQRALSLTLEDAPGSSRT